MIYSAPWSGHLDHQGYLWGRGASDCKNTLTATLESVTLLLEQGFQPRRTLILAYGMDEESKGYEGAGHISEHLESIYGQDGIALILDEGGLGIGEMYGSGFALPATGEKGYLDVNFTLVSPSLSQRWNSTDYVLSLLPVVTRRFLLPTLALGSSQPSSPRSSPPPTLLPSPSNLPSSRSFSAQRLMETFLAS